MWQIIGQSLQPILKASSYALSPVRVKSKPVALPQRRPPLPATSIADIEAAILALDVKKTEWAQLRIAQRADLLEDCLKTVIGAAEAVARTSVEFKGTYGSGIGDELIAYIPTIMGLREFIDTLRAGGQPSPISLKKRRNGQWAASVFPKGFLALLFAGFDSQVWIEAGKEPTQGALYRRKERGEVGGGGVGLVLGAGNQVSVVLLDILHMLLLEDSVVLVKMNPINDCLGPHLREALAPLVERGYVEFVYGGAAEGKAACEHPLVTAVHITGAESTFNHIVWGQAVAPAEGEPRLSKPISAELGNVTPAIVVPGEWTQGELDFQADNVVAGLANNSGHNCVALQVLVTDASWPQRQQFLDAIKHKMDQLPRRAGWYPGSEDKVQRFREQFPGKVEEFGRVCGQGQEEGVVPAQPFVLVTGLKPEEAKVQRENWCTVLQEVALPGTGGDPATFLPAATKFANDQCWGSLASMLIVHPRDQKAHNDAFESALEDLRYGNICVNCPPLVGFSTPAACWGAYPGNTLRNVESGNCYVHNTYMFDHPHKSVVHAPFISSPKPFWSSSCTNTEGVAHAAFNVIANANRPFPGLLYILAAAWNALRS